MKKYRTDLHIHTLLSPCGDWGMSPDNIIKSCVKKKIDIIAVCDHNTTENSEAVIKRGEISGVKVFPGFEICTKEEVHLLAIFETIDDAFRMQRFIYENLSGKNFPEVFGHQVVANMNDEVEGECERFLLGAVSKNLFEVTEKIKKYGGVAIPAHIDRRAYGLISQLGFIPDDLKIDAVEVVSKNIDLKNSANILKLKAVRSSDAHFIEDIGRRFTFFNMEKRTLSEIKKALKGIDGRGIELF